MRTLLISLLLTLPLAAEKVSFDTDDRFSVEFPEGWIKAKSPQKDVVVYREAKDGDGAFSISKMVVKAGAKPDMEATLQAFIENYKKSGMKVDGEPKGQESIIDGKKALVATVPVEVVHEGQSAKLTFFLVLIDAPERLIVMQASLPGAGTNALRRDCRRIIGSFEESDGSDKEEEEQPDDE